MKIYGVIRTIRAMEAENKTLKHQFKKTKLILYRVVTKNFTKKLTDEESELIINSEVRLSDNTVTYSKIGSFSVEADKVFEIEQNAADVPVEV